MNMIALADSSWGIGLGTELLYNIPEDKAYFRTKTTGKTVIMGRITYESLPCGSLPDRKNIILTRNKDYRCSSDVTVCCSFDDLLNNINGQDSDDIFVIGGEQIYKLLEKYCSRAFVTKVLQDKPADKYLMNLDSSGKWQLCEESELKYYHDIPFRFCEYKKI